MKSYNTKQTKHKGVGVAVFISDKADVKRRNVTRDKEEHFIIDVSIGQEQVTTLNANTLNARDAAKSDRTERKKMHPYLQSETVILFSHCSRELLARKSARILVT